MHYCFILCFKDPNLNEMRWIAHELLSIRDFLYSSTLLLQCGSITSTAHGFNVPNGPVHITKGSLIFPSPSKVKLRAVIKYFVLGTRFCIT